MARIGFVGLGVMGFPMAGHLVKAGHEVTVFNRNPARAQAWTEAFTGKSVAT
jgi:3-hydroxyisobutyrate dehydrogenase-like beta-hydroxyacid dehydrogenase